jgi:hypothetical protein
MEVWMRAAGLGKWRCIDGEREVKNALQLHKMPVQTLICDTGGIPYN